MESKIIKFNPKNGDYGSFLESIKDAKMSFSGVRILDKAVFDKMSKEEFGKWSQLKPEKFDGFKDEFELIEAEIQKNYDLASRLYTSKFDEKVKGLSLRELIDQFEVSLLPLRKLSLILQPQLTISTTIHPRTKIKYAVVKAYWIDKSGDLKRSVNRNIGIEQWKFAELASKMFSSFGFTSYEPTTRMDNGAAADLVISKGQKSWIVEIKEADKNEFVKTFISLELWKEYKKEYRL